MSALADIQRVGRALADCFGAFDRREHILREELLRSQQGSSTQSNDMLERRTRRFLVDGILRALGWDASDPTKVREEARSLSGAGDPLYFDYLGLSGDARAPVLIVEAKGADIDAPRPRNGTVLSALETARLVANEISIAKGSGGTSRITAEWRSYLQDLRIYVQSLDAAGRNTLRRVVITTGKWLVIFKDPVATFVDDGLPDAKGIHFFSSVDEIQTEVEQIYLLLYRQCLVDDIPLTMSVADALRWMRRERIDGYLRAALVATTTSGPKKRPYPTRSIYPALAIETGGRVFVVVDYDVAAVEEKLEVDDIAYLLDAMRAKGAALETRMRSVIGSEATPKSLADFAGLPASVATALMRERQTAELGSNAALAGADPQTKRLVAAVGESGVDSELVIVTGETWFYKLNSSTGPECQYHLWRAAKESGATSDSSPMFYSHESFTQDAQDRHCAHGDHRAVRSRICQLDVIETHLCCRACVFEAVCWGNARAPDPCPAFPPPAAGAEVAAPPAGR
jgi:hypothetical protein